jgi:hypothetical protein
LSSAILYGAIVVIWAGVLIPRWLRREPSAETEVPAVATSVDTVAPEPSEKAAPEAPRSRPAPASPRDIEHTRVVRARRRLLGMLVALAFSAAALAEMRLAAWWVVLPPMVMLLGYLALLREASRADAERRSAPRARPARVRAEASVASAAPAPVVPVVPVLPVAPEPEAEVIDITGRVGEEFYDQYTDAKLRAVGD